jgi:hypothetical protein
MNIDFAACTLLAPLAQATGVLSTPLALWQVVAILLFAGGVAAIIIAMRRARDNAPSTHRIDTAQRSSASMPRSSSELSSAEIEARTQELRTLMEDANELAHILGTRLSEQSARLEELITLADDRIERLSQAPAREARTLGSRGESAPSPADALSARVFELADQGLRPAEIARRVGQHAGKVELMLALRGRDATRSARPGSSAG